MLDVGSGEGNFSNYFNKDIKVTSLDVPGAKIKNPNVLKIDFLKWQPKQMYDIVVFWESLEHTANPQQYIKKAAGILRPGGYIFIEFPKFNCWEAILFGSFWFHLDPPRHLVHLTPKGLDNIITRTNLKSIYHSGVFAPEYTIGGFVASILNLVHIQPTDFFKKTKNIFFLFLLIPLFIISAFLETVFFFIGQSPIHLTIARKVA